MSDFSKLSDLFKLEQQLAAYNAGKSRTQKQKELADVNKDGKVDGKDLKIIRTSLNKAKSHKNKVFDFTGDGKINISDWDMLTDMDLDGDGEISDEEKSFIAQQKKKMAKEVRKSINKEKYSGEFDGKLYDNGKLAKGVFDGIYYNKGVRATGVYKSKYYVNGELYSGDRAIVYIDDNGDKHKVKYKYKDGEKLTGLCEDDGKYYKNGRLFTGTVDGIKYKKGVAQNSEQSPLSPETTPPEGPAATTESPTQPQTTPTEEPAATIASPTQSQTTPTEEPAATIASPTQSQTTPTEEPAATTESVNLPETTQQVSEISGQTTSELQSTFTELVDQLYNTLSAQMELVECAYSATNKCSEGMSNGYTEDDARTLAEYDASISELENQDAIMRALLLNIQEKFSAVRSELLSRGELPDIDAATKLNMQTLYNRFKAHIESSRGCFHEVNGVVEQVDYDTHMAYLDRKIADIQQRINEGGLSAEAIARLYEDISALQNQKLAVQEASVADAEALEELNKIFAPFLDDVNAEKNSSSNSQPSNSDKDAGAAPARAQSYYPITSVRFSEKMYNAFSDSDRSAFEEVSGGYRLRNDITAAEFAALSDILKAYFTVK